MKFASKIFNRLKYLTVVVLVSIMVSCDSWLDLGSEDRIMENTLFSSQSGFVTALNGVYIELLSPNLYGGTLSYKTFDVLAQYYDCDKDEQTWQKLSTFDRTSKDGQVSGLWSKAYTLLVNTNTIIEACDEKKDVLNSEYYHVIKGEALALRALLHFELFRVFGPIYLVDPETECMPYAENSTLIVRPLLKASEVVKLIMNDFKAAEILLKDYDPVIKKGALWGDEGPGLPNDMVYRSMRLNYYAVKACMARVALYTGDKETALMYARQVIKETHEDNSWFPFVTRAAATTPLKWDRVYKTEILFGLYNLKRSEVYEKTFSNKLGEKVILRPTDDNIDKLYEEETRINDWRYTEQWMMMKDPDGNDKKHFVKYMAVDDTKETEDKKKVSQGYTYLIPVMRISEMYLIVAECSNDETVAFDHLDRLRAARGVSNANRALGIMTLVEAESRREFIGEGQLFWFYKRQNRSEIPSSKDFDRTISMEKSFYLFDLPRDEKDKRNMER